MIRSHAVSSKDAILEGGSAVALCGQPITNTHWLAFSENTPQVGDVEVSIRWSEITCKACRFAIFPSGYMYAAIEGEEYEQLKAQGRMPCETL